MRLVQVCVVFMPCLAFLPGCTQQPENINTAPSEKIVPKMSVEWSDSLPLTGEKIQGDFNGDGKPEAASTVITSQGVFQQKPFGFELVFSDNKISSYTGVTSSTSDTTIFLINEGNLNDMPGDEISLYMPPMNGVTYSMDTYTFTHGTWVQLMEPLLIPTAFYEVDSLDLQSIIFVENGVVYFNEADVNAEMFTLIKKQAVLNNQ